MKKNRRKVYGLLQLIHKTDTAMDYWTWEVHLSDYPTSLLPFAKITTTVLRGSREEAVQDARHVESLMDVIEYKVIESK
jgi:hypothetical protein